MISRFANLILITLAMSASAADRPNVLWITSEDNSPLLGCYGDKNARTPHLDKLASQGVLYTNAFANAPVCAPSRSTLIMGIYATTAGTQNMRSSFRVPEQVRLYPRYLKDAGYFITNQIKTDYNLSGSDAGWDNGKDWTGRKEGQPFFSIINLGISHESSMHSEKRKAPQTEFNITPPPYHPDVPEIRTDWAYYYEIMSRMDKEVGDILQRLEKDGLAEDTIVFYYSDHGGVITRSKRFLYDTGLRVPLIIRFPKKYQHLAPGEPGTKTDRIVSFVDIPPTLLSLCGIELPKQMQGEVFLGKDAKPPREYAFAFRNRMDERYDFMRSVRDKRFRYIRNYLPHRPLGQHLNYLWKMPATRAWEAAYRDGKCNAAQRAFWEEKAPEELYDLENDPWEVNNLAEKPEFKEVLERLRKTYREHVMKTRDTGFLAEGELVARAEGSTNLDVAQDDKKYPLQKLFDAAELAAQRDEASVPKLIEMLKDEDAGVRYWAAMGCAIRGEKARAALSAVKDALKDANPSVRITAAEAAIRLGDPAAGLPVLLDALDLKSPWDRLWAINVLQENLPAAKTAADKLIPKLKDSLQKDKTEYTSRAGEFLLESLGVK
jgi:N-sulfoglucosamine sulfohydrolase